MPEQQVPFIRLERVSRTYGVGVGAQVALTDVHLAIERGEFVAIVGPSGSGKSTLLNLLGGLDRPTAGAIWVEDVDLAAASEAQLDEHRRRQVGFVFQQFHLNPRRTALENVILPLVFVGSNGSEARGRGLACLERMALADLANRPVSTLSGGQRQRVAIARAIVQSPNLLLADEPVGSLDAATGADVVDLLTSLNREQGLTVLAVSHDQMLLGSASRTFRMTGGHLEARLVGNEQVRSIQADPRPSTSEPEA